MTWFITGAKGRLGQVVARIAEQNGHEVILTDVDELDISDFAAVRGAIRQTQPGVIVNCAAWTDVDGCAREPEKALQINAYGAQNLALAAYEIGADIVQISSNEVFPGTRSTPYHEYDETSAVNPYGYSKLVAERAVMGLNPRHYVVRTAWLFAHGGKNFIHAILNAAKVGKPLRVVTDEIANPTYNDDLAAAVCELAETGRYGIYHLTNEGACSRYALARYALDRAGYTDVPITPISRKEWPRASTPPVYGALANFNAAMLGIKLRTWQDAVDVFLANDG